MFGFVKKRRPFVSAVILAAGPVEGEALLGGAPLLVHSAEAFRQCGRVDEAVVVCREEDLAGLYDLVREFDLGIVSHIVTGGGSWQESVFAGVAACSGEAEYYAVHDGARPLVTEDIIAECLDAAIEHGAAAAGVSSRDTVKLAGEDGFVRATLNRDKTYLVQTPQVFEAGLYRRAMARALREGNCCADSLQLVEREGGRVYFSNGSDQNIRITTPEALAVAQAILEFREEGAEAWRI